LSPGNKITLKAEPEILTIGAEAEMTNRIASYAFIFLTIVSSTSQAQTGQLRGCRLTSRTIILQPGQKPVRLTGALLKEGKNEYRLKANSDLNVDVRMKTDSELKLDIYTVKPPAKFKTNGRDWSHQLTSGNEYLLVVSNCNGTIKGTYQIEITTH
jgi:hypothetical protein